MLRSEQCFLALVDWWRGSWLGTPLTSLSLWSCVWLPFVHCWVPGATYNQAASSLTRRKVKVKGEVITEVSVLLCIWQQLPAGCCSRSFEFWPFPLPCQSTGIIIPVLFGQLYCWAVASLTFLETQSGSRCWVLLLLQAYISLFWDIPWALCAGVVI